MTRDDGIRRHPFLQQLAAKDEDALVQRPPALVRMGTILVASALLCFLAFAEFIEIHSSVTIALVTEENFTLSASSGTSGAPSISGNRSLQALGYLSQIGSVRVGQTIHLKDPLCTGRLCSSRVGVIVNIASESRVEGGYLIRARFQGELGNDAMLRASQQNGRKVCGRILTHDFFLPEPLFTMGESLFGKNPGKIAPKNTTGSTSASCEQ